VKALDVGIIGAGTAGSASALFLARAGHRVTLYERVAEPRAIGAGIVLQPSGMAALEALGLYGAVGARGAPLRSLHCQTQRGWSVVHLEYEDVAPGLFGLGLHRGVLFQALFDAVRADARIEVRCGVGIKGLARGADGRARPVDEQTGAEYGPHQLIVVADGARSGLRALPGVKASVKKYPWGALWFVAKDPQAAFSDQLFQVVRGTRRMLGLLPTGRGPQSDEACVSLFWSLPRHGFEGWKAAGLEAWKAEVLAFSPRAAPVLEQIRSADEVLFAEYHDVVMRPWHWGEVVYLGDAAHATSPQLGQGCNLALVDAEALAACLAECATVAAALEAYSARRRWHLAWYQFATRWLTPFFQSDWAWLGPPRDLGMPLLGLLPWARKQMALSMCGTSRGPLLRALPMFVPRALAPKSS
jgi:2-polyprenyl-6-methoxyphenol hydroxylase-like FAD-dependent oxidoreductase